MLWVAVGWAVNAVLLLHFIRGRNPDSRVKVPRTLTLVLFAWPASSFFGKFPFGLLLKEFNFILPPPVKYPLYINLERDVVYPPTAKVSQMSFKVWSGVGRV